MIRQLSSISRMAFAFAVMILQLGLALPVRAEKHLESRGNPEPFKRLTEAERTYPELVRNQHKTPDKVKDLHHTLPKILRDPQHVAVVLPGVELPLSQLTSFGLHINDFQQRQLPLAFDHLRSHPEAHCIFVTSRRFGDYAWERTGQQLAGKEWPNLKQRLHRFSLGNDGYHWLSSKLLDAPAKLKELSHIVGSRSAFVLPFNVGGRSDKGLAGAEHAYPRTFSGAAVGGPQDSGQRVCTGCRARTAANLGRAVQHA